MPLTDPTPEHPLIRSWLFVPGSRPERFAKACASGADAVIIDLEDAVAPERKDTARAAVVAFMTGEGGCVGIPVFVRLNDIRSLHGIRDLLAICEAAQANAGSAVSGIMLPKVSCAEDLTFVSEAMDDANVPLRIGALIETVAGLAQASAIAKASGRLQFVMFGGADMALDLRVPMEWGPLLSARTDVVRAAAGAKVDAVDMPWIDLGNKAEYESEMQRSFSLGFTSRAAIHPSQITAVHAALTPSDVEIARAREVMSAWENGAGGVALLDGKLIEKRLIAQAGRILSLAERAAGKG
jgi:citrate lyase beta subunit